MEPERFQEAKGFPLLRPHVARPSPTFVCLEAPQSKTGTKVGRRCAPTVEVERSDRGAEDVGVSLGNSLSLSTVVSKTRERDEFLRDTPVHLLCGPLAWGQRRGFLWPLGASPAISYPILVGRRRGLTPQPQPSATKGLRPHSVGRTSRFSSRDTRVHPDGGQKPTGTLVLLPGSWLILCSHENES